MKKIVLALMAVATIAMVGCKNDKKEEPTGPQEINEVQARYNDTIVMKQVMPGYTNYTVTIDNEANGFIEKDTVFVGCIGETTLHITADETHKKDVKLNYVGMEIPNAFIVGFGLDYNELGRNLKDIYVLDQ